MTSANMLEFNVKVLRLLSLWPRQDDMTHGIKRTLKDFFLVFYVTPSYFAVVVGLYYEFVGEEYDISSITESLIAIMCCHGLFYVIVRFVRNRDEIMRIIEELNEFKKFGNPSQMVETDKDAAMFTRFFLAYGLMGTLVYTTMPFVTIERCEANKSQMMIDFGVPCGLVITKHYMPFKYDFSPRKELMILYQITTSTSFSCTVSALTMMLCGILMHITAQLRCLGSTFKTLNDLPEEQVVSGLRTCVRYHIAIISYATRTNNAFGSMMLLHITVTSFVISILSYQVLLTDSYTDSLRYGLHLGGWLSILFLSQDIARKTYFAYWYKFPAAVQKDVLLIIQRAQRPLTLTALNFGVMSLKTYLQVMSTAYSYFTLLLKLKS